ncbi:fibronectin type III domain-containing protein 10 [Ascaphus truei]|uniref:fibronectin type III domain-containing protein 10 n=1 Tax=Ascaphus truei TaxID=8439 RepID=UPI003F59D686
MLCMFDSTSNMIRLHSLFLLCLCEWRPLPVLGGFESLPKLQGDQTWRSNVASPGVGATAAAGSEKGSPVLKRFSQRFRRGTTPSNISSQNSQNHMLPNDFICPYKVTSEGHTNSRSICFRTLDRDFHCDQRNCKMYRSGRSLLANVLRNSSVFLQWQPPVLHIQTLKGFYINCSWNGTFTRFQCDSVQLGISCRDYLLTNVHDNVKYRICLQTLYTNRTSVEECVEFIVEPVGMQDIVIAMTAVGGSICVMLVIICLLVAYITENLMHPAFTHPSSKRGL